MNASPAIGVFRGRTRRAFVPSRPPTATLCPRAEIVDQGHRPIFWRCVFQKKEIRLDAANITSDNGVSDVADAMIVS